MPVTLNQDHDVARLERRFQRLGGVQVASVGAALTLTDAASFAPVRLLAVDASTFARVGYWPEQAGGSLAALMESLVAARATTRATAPIPTIVDDALAEAHGLSVGSVFTYDLGSAGQLPERFMVVASVPHIPQIADLAGYANAAYSGGALVDFSSLVAAIHASDPRRDTPPGRVWLKLTPHASQASLIDQLRAAPYGVADLQSRAGIIEAMRYAPLTLALAGELPLGAALALGLAILMIMLVVWGMYQQHLPQLTLVYALGARRRQLIGTLWLVSGLLPFGGAVVGVVLGPLVAGATIPFMTFARLTDTREPLLNMLLPPPMPVIPWLSLVIGIVSMMGVGGVAIWLKLRHQVRAAVAASLRLNAD